MAVSANIILHLVKKTTVLQVVDFCLIAAGESYSTVQDKIHKLVAKEINGWGAMSFREKLLEKFGLSGEILPSSIVLYTWSWDGS